MSWNMIYTFPNKNKDVVLVGEVLIDIIHKESFDQSQSFVGGSPFNICKNLTKIGITNTFYGAIGNDLFGKKILDEVASKNISAVLNRVDSPTSYVNVNQTYDSPTPEFHRGADNFIYLDNKLITDISFSKILHFTFWPLSKEPSLSTILSLVDKAKANQTLIGFDPNYHPKLDDDNKSGFQAIKDIINKVDIIKPSLDDAERLFGKKTNEEYLDIYESLGPKLIILTLGKDGLIARFNKQTLRMPTMATTVVDSTGAGDAFWSGLYAGLTSSQTIEDSLKLGLFCSSENLKYVGSDVELPKYKDLIQLIRR